MEEKINIAAILKDKKNGIRLYSPIFGDCTFCCVLKDTNDICVKKHNGAIESFNSEGLYFALGEVMLFPSKEMRDWSKLAWNTGDILVNKDGNAHVIFEGFDDDTYETFNGNNYLWKNEGITMCFVEYEDELPTSDFSKANKEYDQKYIHQIEKRLGYKLNIETLKIEKQHEFKDGDVLFVKCNDSAFIEIFEYSKKNGDLCDHASLDITNQILDISGKYIIRKDEITELRLATEAEKQQLFSALANKGKVFDAEKKKIVDFKPNIELKPFDRVLVRDFEDQAWQVSLFSYKDSDSYYCCNGCAWDRCIPYIGNESLLGTTKDMEV